MSFQTTGFLFETRGSFSHKSSNSQMSIVKTFFFLLIFVILAPSLSEASAIFSVGSNLRGTLADPSIRGVTQMLDLVPQFSEELIKDIECELRACFFVTRSGKLFAVGDNAFSYTGTSLQKNNPPYVKAPLEVSLPGPVKLIVAQEFGVHAVLEDNTIYAWGWNWDYNSLGFGFGVSLTSSPTALRVPTAFLGKIVVGVSSSGYTTWFWTKDGAAYAVGQNDYYQACDPSTTDPVVTLKECAYFGSRNIKVIKAVSGYDHTLFLTEEQGENRVYGLGYSAANGALTPALNGGAQNPTEIPQFRGAINIWTQRYSSYVYMNDTQHSLWVMGTSGWGELGLYSWDIYNDPVRLNDYYGWMNSEVPIIKDIRFRTLTTYMLLSTGELYISGDGPAQLSSPGVDYRNYFEILQFSPFGDSAYLLYDIVAPYADGFFVRQAVFCDGKTRLDKDVCGGHGFCADYQTCECEPEPVDGLLYRGEWCNLPSCPSGKYNPGGVLLGPVSNSSVCSACPTSNLLKTNDISQCMPNAVAEFRKPDVYCVGYNAESSCFLNQDAKHQDIEALEPIDRTINGGLYGSVVLDVTGRGYFTYYLALSGDMQQKLFFTGNNRNGEAGIGQTTTEFVDGPVESHFPDELRPWITQMCSSYSTAYFVGGTNASRIFWVGYDQIDGTQNMVNMTEIAYGDYPQGIEVKKIACGPYQLYVQDKNSVWYSLGWGPDRMLLLSSGDSRSLKKMDLLPNDVQIAQICSTYFSTMILSKNNSVYAIGANHYGDTHIGHQDPLTSLTRVQKYDKLDVKSVTCGEDHVLVHVREDDKDVIYCAGYNSLHVCSHPENTDYVVDPVQMDISAVVGDIAQVEATYTNTFLLVQDENKPNQRTRIYGVGADWWASLGAKTSSTFTQERFVQIDDETVSKKHIKELQPKMYGLIAMEATVCNDKWKRSDTVCSNQGLCVKDGYCACFSEYMGEDCQHKVCSAGFFSIQDEVTSQSTCAPCPAGTAGNETRQISNSSCITCPEHTYSSVGTSHCTACPIGYITTGEGKKSVDDCIHCQAGEFVGRYAGETSCFPCPRGSFSAVNGSNACIQCPAGYTTLGERSSSVDDCFVCPSGFYVHNSSNFAYTFSHNDSAFSASSDTPIEVTCIECEVDTYSNSTGRMASCASCPVGSTTDQKKGQRFATDCRTCQDGEYTQLGTGGFVCVQCIAGTYSSSSSFSCHECPPGTWSDQVGQSSSSACQPCEMGRYRTNPGGNSATSCQTCGKGYWSDVLGSDDVSNCIPCPSGYYSNAEVASSADTCAPCPAGSYLSTEAGIGIESCIKCPAGVFSPLLGANSSDVCQLACPAGYYCPEQSAQPIPCPPGTNSSLTNRVALEDCQLTPQGFYSPDDATTVATPCPEGTYNEKSGQNSTSACILCSPGTHSSQSASPSSSTCRPCPPGTFAPEEGSSSCLSCDEFSFCPIGSSAKIPSSLNSLKQEALSQVSPEDDSVSEQFTLASLITKIVFACLSFVAVVLALFCVSCFGLCVGLRKRSTNAIFQIFAKFDVFFQMSHSVKMGKSQIKKQTRLGGLLSLIACGVIVGLALFSIVDLMLNNLIKQESFRINSVPVNGKTIEPANIPGHFSAQVNFFGEWSEESCSAGIVTVTGFTSDAASPTSTCTRSSTWVSNSTTYNIANCKCIFECDTCKVTGTTLRYEFSVPKIFAPSAAYSVEVPHYTYSRGKALPFLMTGTLVPENTDTLVLQGSEPSQVFFSLFASQYIPEISPFVLPFMSVLRFLDVVQKQQDATTGFVMQRVSSQLGSTASGNSTFGASADGVKVVFSSELSRFFFIVEETPRQNTLSFLAQVFALCSAVLSVFALILGQMENVHSLLTKRKRDKKRRTLMKGVADLTLHDFIVGGEQELSGKDSDDDDHTKKMRPPRKQHGGDALDERKAMYLSSQEKPFNEWMEKGITGDVTNDGRLAHVNGTNVDAHEDSDSLSHQGPRYAWEGQVVTLPAGQLSVEAADDTTEDETDDATEEVEYVGEE
eukprot:CAMPEP_0117437920 /NCGR_PEP_ID=MMETSP0759-20121206/1781_1 /TAXON_ID=63605 /ORGANISM="Percolomonas cosmopolitus, Strain WS" /LENGTH=2012 /DNA_ID=CAMNT_0005229585 /DNA_START=183 /DNA_END=6221 /DNA_ORIENTATION=-